MELRVASSCARLIWPMNMCRSYIQGEGRHQGTLFPVLLDDLVPGNHVYRVIDAFVNGLRMADLGFERAQAADTARPGPAMILAVC
jgi:transposase